jgi:hypothetical protein
VNVIVTEGTKGVSEEETRRVYDEGPISAMPHKGYGMNWTGNEAQCVVECHNVCREICLRMFEVSALVKRDVRHATRMTEPRIQRASRRVIIGEALS